MVDVLKKELDLPFEEAVERVKKIVEDDFSILMVKSIDEVMKNNLDLAEEPEKYTTILACGADLAKMALDVSENVGTLMPCSFVVYEKGEKVFVSHVSIMKIASELELANPEAMKPVIEETGKRVSRV
uniref:DUF302 domain-containing protein n=1 Tax=uncultured organism TaxID=155900 RepID=M1Q1M5_9ZZZZ|nr:hypothetical protein FLSS-18_0022 [uncultured organism]